MSDESYVYHSDEGGWIGAPNNGGDLGDLMDITQELNRIRKELVREKHRAKENGLLAHNLGIELQAVKKELKHLADLLDAHFENGGTVAGIGTTNKARQLAGQAKGGAQ